MADRMQFRRDTAANWTAYNPILLEGELGFELDTDQYKLGDGIRNWNNLPYRGMPCVQQTGQSTTTPMSQKAVTKNLANKPDICNDNSSADLNIGDESGNVVVELKEGHVKTKNFDSRHVISDNDIVQQLGGSETKVMSQKAVTIGLNIKPDIMNDTSEADLNIGDLQGNVVAELKGGHIKTKNFDSRDVPKEYEMPKIMNDESSADLNVGDENGNVALELKGGHVKTKNFDSKTMSITMNDESAADLNFGDERGNVVMELKGGHIKTKNFDSRTISPSQIISTYSKIRFASWNIAHFNLGAGITNVINTQEKYEQYLPIYRKIFNKVNADVINLCEFESPFFAGHPEYTTKRELLPNYQYYKDNATATSNGMWVAYFSHLPINNVQEVEFNSHPSNAYRYYLVGDLILNGKSIKVVFTHLTHSGDGQQGSNTYSSAQIQQLIQDFANDEHVIIMADFNTYPTDFQPFKNAGYTMLNHDYMGNIQTAPTKQYYDGAMDNIVVKGGSINNISVLNCNEEGGGYLSDHYLIYCDVVF